MIKIDLNFPIKDLDGKNLANQHAAEIVSNILLSQSKGDAIKYFAWSLSLHKDKFIELDGSDYNKLKDLVENDDKLFVIAKAPILQAIIDAKDKKIDAKGKK